MRAIGSVWRWLQRYALGIPIVLGIFLAVSLAAAFAVAPGFRDPERTEADYLHDFEIGHPGYFEVDRFWIVRTGEEEVLALYDSDPHTGCRALWWENEEYMGITGWFREACGDHYYDYTGRCFGDNCEHSLRRFGVTIGEDGRILVDLSDLRDGPEHDPDATPLVPPPAE